MIRFAAPMLVCASCFAFALSSGAAGAGNRPTAIATVQSSDGSPRGTVLATETKKGVTLTAKFEGLPPGVHGVHIHAVGVCTGPDFASAGGHWNPTMKQHGMNNPQGMHMGDLPNVTIGADGKGSLTFVVANAKIADGAEALLDADGAAIVVHAGPDDLKTDPSGNSGARIACGVFKAQ